MTPDRVSVLLDLRNPLAYLALHRAIAFGARLAIEFDWLPLTTPPLKAPTPAGPRDDRATRHRRYRAQAIAREIETYAASAGLTIRDYYRAGSADAANLAWLWLRDRDRDRLVPYLTELFRSYWSGALDPAQLDPVAGLLIRLGADASSFGSWSVGDGPGVAAAVADDLRARGYFQVPTFVVDDEAFIGRQHLPMVRWILEGRSGPPPI